jgi:NitT/TauT family transport system permease protein
MIFIINQIKYKNQLIITSSIFLIFLIWIIFYRVIDHQIVMPSIRDTLISLINILSTKETLLIIFSTLLRLFVAISFSALIAIFLGVVSGLNKHFSLFLKPYITILRTIPIVSIVLILYVLINHQSISLIITFLMVFPIIYQGVESGILSIHKDLIDVYHLEKNNFLLSIKYLYLPSIKVNITTSFLQSFGLGVKVLIMAEYLTQRTNSIGNSLLLARTYLRYDLVFAWTILIILLSLLIEYILYYYQKKVIDS